MARAKRLCRACASDCISSWSRAGPSRRLRRFAIWSAANRLRTDLAAYGLAIIFDPLVRRQLRAEIRAQFEAFRQPGLASTMSMRISTTIFIPPILTELLDIGRDYGMDAMRVPFEPRALLRAVEPTPSTWSQARGALGRADATGQRGRAWSSSDRVFGLAWSGAMTETRLAGLIDCLLPGGRKSIRIRQPPQAMKERPPAIAIARSFRRFCRRSAGTLCAILVPLSAAIAT